MVADVTSPVSPNFEAALALCSQLSREELCRLFAALGAGACLEAWCDGYDGPGCAVIEGSSPPPPAPTHPIRCWWPSAGAETAGTCDKKHAVTGCPWCRRPVAVLGHIHATKADIVEEAFSSQQQAQPPQHAYVTLLYGPSCHEYFLGALVLGFGLLKYGRVGAEGIAAPAQRVLMHTPDVPDVYLEALAVAGWTIQRVEYLSSVSRALFHNYKTSRFIDVFTKLRALQLTQFEKVMLLDLDMLVRSPGKTNGLPDNQPLESIFALQAPAAMKRGPPVPEHGEIVAYADLWAHPTRRKGDALPFHQQASGINAGVMLLHPDADVHALLEKEVRDWYHPEHYATYMPEQEYLTRFYGTFACWRHIACCYNFEIDKNERVPHDFTQVHEDIRARDAASRERQGGTGLSHPGAVVLHYSGSSVKPWKLLWTMQEGYVETPASLLVESVEEIAALHGRLAGEGSDCGRLEGYADRQRLFAAMLEWLAQFKDISEAIKRDAGIDVIELVKARSEVDRATAERKRSADNGTWNWSRSSWARGDV